MASWQATDLSRSQRATRRSSGFNIPPANLFVVWRGNSGVGTGVWIGGGQDCPSHMAGGTNLSIVQRNIFVNVSVIPDGLPCIRVDASCTTVYVAGDNACLA